MPRPDKAPSVVDAYPVVPIAPLETLGDHPATVLMILSFLGCVWIVAVDTTSAFGFVYYPALIVTAICSALMVMAWRKERRGEESG